MRPTRYPYKKIPLSDTTKVVNVIRLLKLILVDLGNFKGLSERAKQSAKEVVEQHISDLKSVQLENVPTLLKLQLRDVLECCGYVLELHEHGQVRIYNGHELIL